MDLNGLKLDSAIESLKAFRNELYDSFPLRADAIMDLLDALISGSNEKSVIEHSLNPLFRRQYGSLHDAIHSQALTSEELKTLQLVWMRLAARCVPAPIQKPFYLLGIDTTGFPRPFAATLEDKTVNYHPNPAPGNNPIQVGHVYSLVAALPEKDNPNTPPWIIPLNITRVPSDKNAIKIAVTQLDDLLGDADLPFQGNLTALTGDTVYGSPLLLSSMGGHPNLVVIARVRGNRKFFRQSQAAASGEKGHPVWYGLEFGLKDPFTWGWPDDSTSVPFKFKNGREAIAQIDAWDNLVMRGKRELPMHEHPFTLVRIVISGAKGKEIFKHPLWLIAVGKRRQELTLADIYSAYRQRYDLEHFFRYGKQKLLLAGYQTAETRHEENWAALVLLAYTQLYLMAALAARLPRPWERNLPRYKNQEANGPASPSETRRDAARILREVGTPACNPKPRGQAPGRPQGKVQEKRARQRVIIKGKAVVQSRGSP